MLAGCKKESLTGKDIKASHFTIEEAKAWFTSYNSTSDNQACKKGVITIVENPKWDITTTSEDVNYTCIEVPVRIKYRISPLPTNNSVLNIGTKFLLLKSKTTDIVTPVLMNIVSETSISINDFNYRKIPTAFTGKVYFFDLNTSEFMNGWTYVNGVIVGSMSNEKVSSTGCTVTQIGWFLTMCYYYTDGTSECDDPEYLFSIYISNCGGSSDTGGGVNPPPPPVNCADQAEAFANAGSVQSGPINQTTTFNDGTDWNINYNWIIFTAGPWHLKSYEQATLKKINYPNNYSRWEYQTFTHASIGAGGVVAGGTRTFTYLDATINFTPQTSWMRIDFGVDNSIICSGSPFAVPGLYNANKVFHAPGSITIN